MKAEKTTHTLAEAIETIEQQGSLTVAEQKELARCEQQVASGMVAAALALKAIRDKKLYRAEFSTWEAYVQDRWEYSKSYSHNLIVFAEIYEIIGAAKKSTTGTLLLPTFERQVRPLAKLDDDKKVIVWLEAVKRGNGKSPSGVLVEEVVAEMMGTDCKTCEPKAGADQAPETTEATGMDETGQREDTPETHDDVASMNASDDVAQQDVDAHDDSIVVVNAATDGEPSPELGDGNLSAEQIPEAELDKEANEDVSGWASNNRFGEPEASASAKSAPTPLKMVTYKKTRADELAEQCRNLVASDVDATVATRIYDSVRAILAESLMRDVA